VVAAEDRENKQILLQNSGWLQTLDTEAVIASPTHMVLLHGVRIKAIDMDKPETAIEGLRAQNTQILGGTKIKKISWAKTPLPATKEHTSIVVGFESPSAANRAIERGMAMESNIHGCELFDVNCRRRQCFRCQQYGHISAGCRKPLACNYCSGHHLSSDCASRAKNEIPVCAACGEKGHPAWDRNCTRSRAEDQRIRVALNTRPLYYNEEEERREKATHTSTKNPTSNSQEVPVAPIENAPIPEKRGRGKPRKTQEEITVEPQPTPTLNEENTPIFHVSSQGRACAPTKKVRENGWATVSGKKRKSTHSPAKERCPLEEVHTNTRSAPQPRANTPTNEMEL
jgi:hypothetical protein